MVLQQRGASGAAGLQPSPSKKQAKNAQKAAKDKADEERKARMAPLKRVRAVDENGNPVSWNPFSKAEMTFHGFLLIFLFCIGWFFSKKSTESAFDPSRRRATAPHTLLGVFANKTMDWKSSTTPAPISVASILAKAALRGEDGHKKPASGSVALAPFRQRVMAGINSLMRRICENPADTRRCDASAADGEFGITPLHLAHLYGDADAVSFLMALGADPDAMDDAGRKPANLSFEHFVGNSRKWAAAEGRTCELPEVVLDTSAGLEGLSAKIKEVRRLVIEGEPVVVRNVMDWVKFTFPSFVPDYPDSESFVARWGNQTVDVGGVPYAQKFGLETRALTLSEYQDTVMRKHEGKGAPGTPAMQRAAAADADPPYVFQQDSEACGEGYHMMDAFLAVAFPTAGKAPLICPPSSPGLGRDSMHYFLGSARSGAPLHVHSDAANFVLMGSKRWWVVPPRAAEFSTKHIHRWLVEDFPRIPAAKRPLECVQRAGDLVYVPFDWGHGAINLEDATFGYTMELVNRRDTLMSIMKWNC